VNFLSEIQPECDCMPSADVPVIQDKGILVSDDPVSIEQASIDLLRESGPLPESLARDRGAEEGDDILMKLHGRPYLIQLTEAERLGLGVRKYDLVSV
ncbi:MAG: DUF362 domain-containing protein, partial [Candidatus Sulfobium sp.]